MRRWPDGDFAAGTESLAQDVRVGLGAMRRRPGVSVIAVAALAIGIGANVTMFAAIDALLVRTPPHVQHAERIHRVYFEFPSADGTRSLSSNQGYRTYATIRDNVSGLEAVAALSAATISTGRGAGARPVDAVLATPSYFTVLGVRPALGRFFTPDEELDEREHVAVLGHDAWQAQFGGDSSILGRTIDVAGAQHTIVGVAPDGFTGAD